MSPILAQNQTTDTGRLEAVRNSALFKHVFRALEKIRNSPSLTVTFWGAVLTLVAFVVHDGVWAGIVGVWGLAIFVFGASWYGIARWYMAPDRATDDTDASDSTVEDRISWAQGGVTVGMSIAIGSYAAYTTAATGIEYIVFPLAFVGGLAALYTKPTLLEVIGNGLYILGALLFMTPIVFYVAGIPQSAQNAGIQIDHMMALGSLLFVFSLIAVVVSVLGYFVNNQSRKKSDQQRFKSRMGSN